MSTSEESGWALLTGRFILRRDPNGKIFVFGQLVECVGIPLDPTGQDELVVATFTSTGLRHATSPATYNRSPEDILEAGIPRLSDVQEKKEGDDAGSE